MSRIIGIRSTLGLTALGVWAVACTTPAPSAKTAKTGEAERYAEAFRVVRVDVSASVPTQLAVHACAGLRNRELGGSVFVQTDEDVPQSRIDGAGLKDELWLETLGLRPTGSEPYAEFLSACLADFGCARYDYGAQQEILPAILTASAALGVVPLAEQSPLRCETPAFDAVQAFAGKDSQLASTRYVYENHLDKTTGLAMLNPGYDREPEDLANPGLIEDMPVALIDLVFSRRLFVVFLINGCTKDHPERALLTSIVADSPWEKPVGVYGYNDSWLVGGYMWEAQSRCLDSADLGAIPTRTTNLSFFDSRGPAIEGPEELPRIEPQAVDYDPGKTYVAFVVGDGDNVRYIMSTRKEWLEQRLALCKRAATKCPPLSWSISPHLPDIAPDILKWYYRTAQSTGADYFVLPPSGYLYAYPSSLNAEDGARFVARTEEAGRILGTRSVVHWEWFDSWGRAMAELLPQYARKGGQIRGIFPMNVPYLIEAFSGWPAEQMNTVLTGRDGGKVAVFRSQSWRGVDGSDDFHMTPQAMADRLGALPKGTVAWMYMTSDGGLSLENSYFALLPLLPAHVQLVSADAAADLALR